MFAHACSADTAHFNTRFESTSDVQPTLYVGQCTQKYFSTILTHSMHIVAMYAEHPVSMCDPLHFLAGKSLLCVAVSVRLT